MARYFFDATNEDLLVTDFHGSEIDSGCDVQPSMIRAVHAIRTFLGEELASKPWILEVRRGESDRVAAVPFADVEAMKPEGGADASLALAA